MGYILAGLTLKTAEAVADKIASVNIYEKGSNVAVNITALRKNIEQQGVTARITVEYDIPAGIFSIRRAELLTSGGAQITNALMSVDITPPAVMQHCLYVQEGGGNNGA